MHRFICSYLVLPAGNCWLVAPASPQTSDLIQSTGASPVLSVVRTPAAPLLDCCSFWMPLELEPSLALLRQVPARPWQFPSDVYISHSCSRTEHTEIWIHLKSVCQGNKALGSDDLAVFFLGFFCYILLAFLKDFYIDSHFRFRKKENRIVICWAPAIANHCVRQFHSFSLFCSLHREVIDTSAVDCDCERTCWTSAWSSCFRRFLWTIIYKAWET